MIRTVQSVPNSLGHYRHILAGCNVLVQEHCAATVMCMIALIVQDGGFVNWIQDKIHLIGLLPNL